MAWSVWFGKTNHTDDDIHSDHSYSYTWNTLKLHLNSLLILNCYAEDLAFGFDLFPKFSLFYMSSMSL